MFVHFLRYRLKRSWLIAGFSLAIILGALYTQHHSMLWPGYGSVALLLVIAGWRAHAVVLGIGLIMAGALLGMYRGHVFADRMTMNDALIGQKVTLIGTARSDAVYGDHYQLTFDMGDARLAAAANSSALIGTLTISGFGESSIFKGDTVQVRGTFQPALGNNIGRISYGQLAVLAHHDTLVDRIRRKFVAGMQSALPEPVASFGLGLLVGQRNTLPDDVSEQLKRVGLTHIIAVSGYNLMIMLRASKRLMGRRSKFQYFCLSLLLMGIFLLLAGSSPSIIRASVICCLSLLAWYYGRSVQPIALLLLAAAITVLANPLYAWGNVSWYLSFLAFFGVLVLSPLLTQRLYKSRTPGLVGAIVLESLCAEIMTLPYVLYIFGQMSTVGLWGNLVIASFVPLAMLLAVVAGLAGMLMPAWAGWFAWPATLVMNFMLDGASLLSSTPHAFIESIAFPSWMLATAYGLIGFVMLTLAYRNHQNYAIITDKNAPP